MPRTLILWAMRIGLIVMFVLHIHSAYSLKEMSPTQQRKSRVRQWSEKLRRQAGFRGGILCQSHHALDRADHRPLRAVPSSRSHLGLVAR